MRAVLLRRFSKPSFLRSMQPSRLKAFLAQHWGYLEGRGFKIPDDEKFDYETLADILASPDETTPGTMIESFCIVDEMSTPEIMDELLEGAPLDEGSELTPMDVAIDVYLTDPEFLHRKHRERCIERLRTYVVLEAKNKHVPWSDQPEEKRIASLELALGEYFARRRRGREVRVFMYPREDEVWFLVRHGETYRRDERQEGKNSGTVSYRPVKYDVVVFDRRSNELRLSGRAGPLHKLYRMQFGSDLFDDPDHFQELPRYTLEPLREDGESSLICSDVEGLESVRLREVEITIGGDFHYRVVLKARDLFAYWQSHGKQIPSHGELTWAKFTVKYADSQKSRSVEIRVPYQTKYTRDGDDTPVEQWLALRGFRLNVPEQVLAGV